MAFIKTTETTKVTIFKGWKITKVNNGVIFTKNNPFETAYSNSFLDIIDIDSEKAIDSLPKSIKQNERSVAEVLAANMRKMIISERPNNPAYFDKMSELLNQLLQEQKDGKL